LLGRHFTSSLFMVAGCAMGAGCLAMPLLAVGPNFLISSIFLIIVAIFSYYLALYSMEIFILYKNDINISTIVKKNFGNIGVVINGLINGIFMYTLLSVYMTGGVDLLNKTILPLINIHINNHMALILFMLIFLPFFFRGASLVVKTNKYVFYLKLLSFLVVIFCGLFVFNSKSILSFNLINIQYIPRALPVFLGALWFHLLIPIITKLNDYDRHRCKLVFKFGLLIPLVLYILWIGIILNLIPREGTSRSFYWILHNNLSVGTMVSLALTNNQTSNIMKFALNFFSNIALLTSFLTVGLSTYDYMRDLLNIRQTHYGITQNLVITMLPPCFIVLFFSNGFVMILQQAIILLLLTNIFTILCVIKEHRNLIIKPNKNCLYLVLCLLILFIILQLLDNFSILPSFGF
jgi:amino acid permease